MNIEGLGKVVQTGEVEKLFPGNSVQPAGKQDAGSQGTGKSFSDLLKDSIDKVNTQQAQADTAVKELIAGRNKNIHETMLTVERADTSLKLMMQVRNKVLDAYKEIMRMQV